MVHLGGARRRRLTGLVAGVRRALHACLWTRPVAATQAAGIGQDLMRSRAQLLAENALLCQQLVVLRRGVARLAVTRTDRALLVLLAGRVRAWRQALLIVQLDTPLRWHRQLFRGFWRRKSQATSTARRAKVSAETSCASRKVYPLANGPFRPDVLVIKQVLRQQS